MYAKKLNCGIYKITNLVNGKSYVGKSKNIRQRWAKHKRDLRKNEHDNCYLQRAYNLYGAENFVYSVLIYCEIFELGYYESKFKKCLHAEYNIADIDENGKQVASEETRKKISESRLGEDNPFYGKNHSEEARKKMSENGSMYGKTGDKNPSSKAVLQFTLKSEFIARYGSIREAERQTGIASSTISGVCLDKLHNNSAGGFLWCFEDANIIPTYAKTITNNKPVIQFSKEGVEINRFISIAEAGRKVGIDEGSIGDVCSGNLRCKTAGGYLWCYQDSEDIPVYEKPKNAKKSVVQFSKDGKEIQCFESMNEAARITGINIASIWSVCLEKPHCKTAGGYIWKYAE